MSQCISIFSLFSQEASIEIKNESVSISAPSDIRLSTGASGKTYYNGEEVAVKNEMRRSSTIIIAAVDASEKSKSGADIICTGANDQNSILEAFHLLPDYGGSLYLTEGNFYLSESVIYINKNLRLSGSGEATVLHRKFDSGNLPYASLISIDASKIVSIQDLAINQHKTEYTSGNNIAILMLGENPYGRLSISKISIYNSSGPCIYTINSHLHASHLYIYDSNMGVRFFSGNANTLTINNCVFHIDKSYIGMKIEGQVYAANISGNFFNRSKLDIEGDFHTITGNLMGALSLRGKCHIVTGNNTEGITDDSKDSLIESNR